MLMARLSLFVVLLFPFKVYTQNLAIIGAGLSGLSAAYTLEKFGFKADIYEARNRVGGRMHSVNIEGLQTQVEMGGTFLDSKHHEFKLFLEGLGVETLKVIEDNPFLHYQVLNKQLTTSDDNFSRFYETIKRLHEERLEIARDPHYKNLHKMTLKCYLDSLGVEADFETLVSSIGRNEYGTDLEALNALMLFELVDFDLEKKYFHINGSLGDEAYIIKGGSRVLFEKLRSVLNSEITFHYAVRVIRELPDLTFELVFDTPDGEVTKHYDDVIITLPLPILRETVKLEIPNLHPDIQYVLKHLGTGKNTKLILYFSKPFWLSIPHGNRFNVITDDFWIWDNSDVLQSHGAYGLTAFAGGRFASLMEMDTDELVRSILSDCQRALENEDLLTAPPCTFQRTDINAK